MNSFLIKHVEAGWRITFYYEKPHYYVKVQHKNKQGEMLFSSIFESGLDYNMAWLQAHEWITKQETMHG